MSHVTSTNESCHAHKLARTQAHTSHKHAQTNNWATSHSRTSHMSCARTCSHAGRWISSTHTIGWMSHVTPTDKSRHTYTRVMAHTRTCSHGCISSTHTIGWMRHVTPTNKSCHTFECVTSHTWTYWVATISRLLKMRGLYCKWEVSYLESRLFCRALLQKRPMILRSLLIVNTSYSHLPCRQMHCRCISCRMSSLL